MKLFVLENDQFSFMWQIYRPDFPSFFKQKICKTVMKQFFHFKYKDKKYEKKLSHTK